MVPDRALWSFFLACFSHYDQTHLPTHTITVPVYEFSCKKGCDNYEVWRSISERTTATECPGCGEPGQRVFSPPMTLSGPLRLKQESSEPRVVRKTVGSETKPRLREAAGSRPWMLNRDC